MKTIARTRELRPRAPLGLAPERVAEVLDKLVAEARVERVTGAEGGSVYRAQSCLIHASDPIGFEGAVYDHMQALIGALCRPGRASWRC